MKVHIDTSSLTDYETFLRIKSLPKFSFVGRTAEFPDEYASFVGSSQAAAIQKEIPYEPLPGLFDYQEGIARISIKKRKFAAFVEPGMGKTLIYGEFVRHALKCLPKNRCALMIAPLMVVPQAIEEYQKFYGEELKIEQVRSSDLNLFLRSGDSRLGITNYEALNEDTEAGRLGCLVPDECFPAGTPIDFVGENGEIYQTAIENVVCGDTIRNASGVDVVSDVHRREVQYAVKVEFGEASIITSPNHPFFTQRGWVGAQDIKPGDSVLRTSSAMRMVRDDVYSEADGIRQILQSVLLSEMADDAGGCSQETVHFGNGIENIEVSDRIHEFSGGSKASGVHSEFESYVRPEGSRQSLPPIARDEPQTFRAWGKWDWFNSATEDFTGCSIFRLAGGICVVFGETNTRLSIALQDRHRKSQQENSYRGGWKLPSRKEGSGRKEGCEADFARVVGIEVLEQGDPRLEKLRDEDGKLYFYDIEAKRHPSFSINGLLVHNSSRMKSHYGKQGQTIIRLGKGLDWKMAGTGTPAPNDRIEYANHAVFLDHYPTVNSFLARFFVNRGQTDNRWELKPHALEPFYRALSHWCIFLTNPATYGWKDNAGTLPPIRVHIHDVSLSDAQRKMVMDRTGDLFGVDAGGITSRSALGQIAKGSLGGKRVETLKPAFIRNLVDSWPDKSTLIWCIYDAEQETIAKAIPDAHSMDGNTPHEKRVQMIHDFKSGKVKTLISKAKILGFGLNLQIATKMIFSGLQDSFEDYFQCVKRANRFGSTEPLDVHIPITPVERPMVENVLRKSDRVQADTVEQERIFKSSAKGIYHASV